MHDKKEVTSLQWELQSVMLDTTFLPPKLWRYKTCTQSLFKSLNSRSREWGVIPLNLWTNTFRIVFSSDSNIFLFCLWRSLSRFWRWYLYFCRHFYFWGSHLSTFRYRGSNRLSNWRCLHISCSQLINVALPDSTTFQFHWGGDIPMCL